MELTMSAESLAEARLSILKSERLQSLPPDYVKRVRAKRWIRPMRGSSQAQMCLADDGHTYIVKSLHNPQGRRTLANEWITSGLFRHCGISAARDAAVLVDGPVLEELRRDVHTRRYWGEVPTLHFGSRTPVDPENRIIYDSLTARMMAANVANLKDFWGALVLDTWVGNSDERQAVFYRDHSSVLEGQVMHAQRFVAVMVDHGQAFQGERWMPNHRAFPYQGGPVYVGVSGPKSFLPWIDKVSSISTTLLDALRWAMPAAWIDGDEHALDCLLEDLFRRRNSVAEMLDSLCRANPTTFPNWKKTGLWRVSWT